MTFEIKHDLQFQETPKSVKTYLNIEGEQGKLHP